jgi:hypothetical protein
MRNIFCMEFKKKKMCLIYIILMDIFQIMQDNLNLIVVAGIVLLLAYGFYSYSIDKFTIYDRMTNVNANTNANTNTADKMDAILSPDPMKSSALNPHDLLPNNEKNKWTTLNPITQNSMTIPDVMQSDFFIGVNTTGTTKKNPNLQGIGREDPVIAKIDTSGKFNISSIDPR